MWKSRERKGTYKTKENIGMKLVKGERNKEKEDALNAKIAAIREANKIIEERHREVEADRLEAERNNASVTLTIKKRSKSNSLSSSIDSEIAELNDPPKSRDGKGIYEEKEDNVMRIEKPECIKVKKDAPSPKMHAIQEANEGIEQLHQEVKAEIDKCPNINTLPENSFHSEIAELDIQPKSKEVVYKEKEVDDMRIAEAECNNEKDASSSETSVNNSIDYEIAQLKLAIESEIDNLRRDEPEIPVTKMAEAQTMLENEETIVTPQVDSHQHGENVCLNCYTRHKAKLIIERAALLADW